MRCFVLGNGRSRLELKLNLLKRYGKIFGCNALYREFDPDYLIAVDPKMVVEIERAGYQRTHEVWTNPNSKYRNFQGFNFFSPSLGWSSGPTALDFAVKKGGTEIWIFGFDFIGNNGLVNNIYADTINYRSSSDPATYYGNWQRQTEQVIKVNHRIKFYRVIPDNYHDPEWNFTNFKHVKYQDFYKIMQSWNEIM